MLLRRVLPLGTVVVLVAGTALAARAATGSDPSGQYRTAAVTRGDVQQELDLTGVVTPVQQVAAGFSVAGTVQTVGVTVGEAVTAGQVLATLDPGPLQGAVTVAAAGLASANAALETAGTSTTTTTSSTASTASTAPARTSGTSPAAAQVDLSRPERAVQQAQAAVGAALQLAGRDVADEQQACATGSSPTPSPGPTAPTPGPTHAAAAGSASPATSRGHAACTAAITAASAAQQALFGAQTGLATAQAALSDALSRASTAARSTSTGTSSGGSSSGSSSGASSSGASSPGGSSSGASSSGASSPGGSSVAGGAAAQSGGTGSVASRVDAARVTVLQAQATLSAAQASLAGATLTAPVAGTVAAVPFTVGGTAATSDAVTLVGSGAVRVTVDVPLASRPKIAIGQAAHVTPLGSTTPVDGAVESISLLPTSSTATTYPVVVLVPAPPPALAAGASAEVGVVLATAHDVVQVPASAVTLSVAGTASVLVLSGGTQTRTVVRTGAVGETMVEVTSGLDVGSRVVLADLSRALPASSTTATRFTGGGAGFGGAGGGGRAAGGAGRGAAGG